MQRHEAAVNGVNRALENADVRLWGAAQAVSAVEMMSVTAGVTIASGGAALAVTVPLMLHLADNAKAGVQQLLTGRETQTWVESKLQSTFHLSDTQAAIGKTVLSLGSAGRASSFNRFRLFAQSKGIEAGKLAINANSPSEIAWGYGNLSARQSTMLKSLTDPGDFLQLHKSHISPTDLAALTAHTGDEFALFTLGSRRIAVRGTSSGLEIRGYLNSKLLDGGWRWSAHTHPGLSDRVLTPYINSNSSKKKAAKTQLTP